MLDVEQKREMIQFVLETEQQQGFSAIPCTNPDSFGARIDTSQPLTEIREGDLYFCLEEREVAVQGKKVDLSVREFNALYLLLMSQSIFINSRIYIAHYISPPHKQSILALPHLPIHYISQCAHYGIILVLILKERGIGILRFQIAVLSRCSEGLGENALHKNLRI